MDLAEATEQLNGVGLIGFHTLLRDTNPQWIISYSRGSKGSHPFGKRYENLTLDVGDRKKSKDLLRFFLCAVQLVLSMSMSWSPEGYWICFCEYSE